MQLSVAREYERQIYPSAAVEHGQPLDFDIKNGWVLFSSLYDTFLFLRCRIRRDRQTNLDAADRVGPTNLLAFSMFRNVDCEINGKTITEAGNLYPYKALMWTVLNNSKDYLEMAGICDGYQRDTPGHVGETSAQSGAAANNSTNVAHAQRALRYRESAQIVLCARPCIDLFHQETYLPHNTEMHLRFHPNQENFCLMTADARDYYLEIMSAHMKIQTHELTDGVVTAIERQQIQRPLRMNYTKISANTRYVPAGVTSVNLNAMFQNVLPTRLIIMLVDNAHMNGTRNSNPFNLQHFNVQKMSLIVNSEEIPYEGYNTNFDAGGDTTEGYIKVLSALGLLGRNSAIDLTHEIWRNGFTFWVFKISPGPVGEGVGNTLRTGNCNLSITFSAATPNVISCIMLSEYPACLEIDSQRNVTLL
jgi:hypothetical protein